MMLQATEPPIWLQVLRSPATVLFALAFCVKWVVAPAVNAYVRHELRDELRQIAAFPKYVDRLEHLETAIERFSEVPEQLARIEEQIKALFIQQKRHT